MQRRVLRARQPRWLGPSVHEFALVALVSMSVGCPADDAQDVRPNVGPTGTQTATATAPNRFVEIRDLLREDPVATARAHLLTPKVNAICKEADPRSRFFEDAASQVAREGPESRRLAEDVVEYVAQACFRSEARLGLELLEEASRAVPSPSRWDVLRARLLAADGRESEAKPFAESAMKAGSVHARALLANILAGEARAAGPGYRPGMFGPALEVVAAEPDGNWPLIDLTAVLSTRVRLLSERAVYEPTEARLATLREARAVYERLGLSPFPARVRSLSLDAACVDSVELGETGFAACARAAELHGHLGAAFLAGRGEDPKLFDLDRLASLKKLRLELQALGRGHVAVIAFRGDETELVSWIRPLAELLRTLDKQKVKLVLYARSASPRIVALAHRAFELAEAKSAMEMQFEGGVEAMPCIAALLAKKPVPAACPLTAGQRSELTSLGRHGVAVLVGRDLDAELEDLAAVDLSRVLLSIRQPATDRPMGPQLVSLSDVYLLSHRAKELGGRMRSRPDAP